MRGWWLVAGIALLSARVRAQTVRTADTLTGLQSGHTLDVTAGLGVGGFTSSLGQLSTLGVTWTLRGGYNFSRFFGVEFSYLGTSTNESSRAMAAGGACCAAFLENQLVPGVKAGLPIPLGRAYLRPYAAAGAGWSYLEVSTNVSGVSPVHSQSAGAFPFSGGLAIEFARGKTINEFIPGLIFDVRYTYTVLTIHAGNMWGVLFEFGGRIPSY